MPGLILELQADALDGNHSVSALLRKALLICRKLGVNEIERWINNELNGYDGDEVPKYREVKGAVNVWNPYNGWQPLHFGDAEFGEMLSRRRIGQRIGELEDLKGKTGKGHTFEVPFTVEQTNALMNSMEVPLRPTLHVSSSSILGIIDSVRNRILDWALELERRGIVGEGMTFSREERTAAVANTYQITNNIGTMSNSQIQQHSSGSMSSASGLDVAGLREILSAVREVAASGSLPSDKVAELEADLQTLEVQASAPKPRVSIIGECLRSIRTILEEAAGSVLGSSAILKLGAFIDTLPR